MKHNSNDYLELAEAIMNPNRRQSKGSRIVIRFELENDGGFQMNPKELIARIVADDLAIDLITEGLNKIGYKTTITLIERS